MDELKKAYIAGFFDGEGCVQLCKYRHPKTRGHLSYYLRVVIANTEKEVLEQIQQEFGGKVKQRKRVKPHHKDNFYLEISTQQARAFLESVLPYLRIKRRQAELGIELANSVHSTWGETGWHKRLPVELFEYRDNLREQVLALNDRR